jgi:micrococcal nuclease
MTPDYKYRARYVSNYDGDTIRFDIDLGFSIQTLNQIFRLKDINCHELQGESAAKGRLARDFVRAILTNAAEIVVHSEKDRKEKYGRWLAEVYYRNAGDDVTYNLNAELVAAGHAVHVAY